jgi:hypothetical protein
VNASRAIGFAGVLLGIAGFGLLAFVSRNEFTLLIAMYAFLFAIYAGMWERMKSLNMASLIFLVLAVRIPFFFNLPELSDDFYRFLWDGMLVTQGINPFAMVPNMLELSGLQDPDFAAKLLDGMNSPGYTSVYPLVHQAFFGVGYALSGNDLLQGVNVMRGGMLSVELLFLWTLTSRGNLAKGVAAAYLLNPLVVVEGVGNLHFEAVLLPLLAWGVLLLTDQKPAKAAWAWAGSVLVKLTPLLLVPYFWFRLKNHERLVFFGFSTAVLIAGLAWMWPVGNAVLQGDGIGLYFKSFEFNASVYYVVSAILQSFLGYNPIGVLGPAMAVIAGLAIVAVSYRARHSNPWEVCLLIYLIYYFFATIVHPWYLIPIVFFAIAANRPLALVWAFGVWLSYAHYLDPLGPKWVLILIEYILLFAALIAETRRNSWFQPSTEAAALRG